MFIISKELSLSTNKIAAEVGVKDHTTVMHAFDKIGHDIGSNAGTAREVKEIEELRKSESFGAKPTDNTSKSSGSIFDRLFGKD